MNAETFNALHEVGIPVFAYPGARPEDDRNAARLVTRTRSRASVLGGHTDVVWVDGHSACIALSRVDVVTEAEFEAAKLADAVRSQGALPVPTGSVPQSQPLPVGVLVELQDLRTRLAGMANPPREVFLALYDGVEPGLFTTVGAAREFCDDVAKADAGERYWDWIVNEYGVHVQFWTHPDDDRPLSETSGSVTPIVVQGDDDLSELERLRARFAELEAREAIVSAFVAKRAEYITAIRNCHPDNGHDYDRWQGHAAARRQLAELLGLPVAVPPEDAASVAKSVDRLTRMLAPTQALREDKPAALRAENTADLLTLAAAQHADATYNATSQTIRLELTATEEQWTAWQTALSVDLARTTHRGGTVTSHAVWHGTHVAIRCRLARPEGEFHDALHHPYTTPHDMPEMGGER